MKLGVSTDFSAESAEEWIKLIEDNDMPMIIEHLQGDNEYRASVEYVRKRLQKGVI